MSELLAQGEVSSYQQGSQYQALLLDAMLQGSEPPVPPYQLLTQTDDGIVVRNITLGDHLRKPAAAASDESTSYHYRKAIKELRATQNEALRGSQYGTLANVDEQVGGPLTDVCFSPVAVDLVGNWVRGLGRNSVVLSKFAVLEAITTPAGFRAAVDKIASIAPHILLPTLPTLSGFIPQETIRGWIDTASTAKNYSHRSAFVNNLVKAAGYFEGEEDVLAERLKASLSQMHNVSVLETLVRKPITLQYLTPAEARKLVADNLATIPSASTFPDRELLDGLVERGLATPAQIEAAIVEALIANQDAGSTALRKPADVLSQDGMTRVKTTLLEQFNDPVGKHDGYKRISALSAIVQCDLFSPAELKQVFETCIGRGEGNSLMKHIETVSEVLSQEQTKAVITQAVREKKVGYLFAFTAKKLLDKVELAPDVTFELIKQIVSRSFHNTSPKTALPFLEYLPFRMRGQLIKDIVASSPVDSLIYEETTPGQREDRFMWLSYLGTPNEAVDILRKHIEETRGFNFARHTLFRHLDSNYLPQYLFASDETEAMVRERVHATKEDGTDEYSTSEILRNFATISAVLTDRSELSELIRGRGQQDPEALFNYWLEDFGVFFSSDEVMDMLEAAWPKDMVDMPRVNEALQAYLPQDKLVELYSSHMALCDHEEDIDLGIDDFINRLDPETASLFIRKLLDKNPHRLLDSDYATELLGLERSELVEFINQHTGTFAPKTLGKLNRRYERANPYQKRLLDKDKDDLYQAFAWINHAGLNDTYEQLLEGAHTEKAERELLHLLSSVGRQISWYQDTSLNTVKNLRELRTLVEDVTLHELGIAQLTNEQRTHFRSLVTDILPFGVYAARYVESVPHRDILTDMIEATTTPGAYQSWRFARDITLAKRKELGWVPRALTEEQFEQWAQDDKQVITLGEARNDAVGGDIAELIRENTEHLGVSDDLSDPEARDRLDDLIRKLGQELKEAHAGQKHRNGTVNVDEIAGWLKGSKYVRAAYVMYNADRFTAQQIKQTMRDFRAGLPADGKFLADRVEEMLAFADTSLEDVVITDTSDPQITIEIGAKPVPSCQHYANGSFNENLLGYFDVDVKPIIIRGKNDNIVARAIMRLLETEAGEPVLYVEPTYTSYNQAQVSQAVQAFVIQKAAKLGVAYISSDENDDTTDESEVTVRSRGSRAPERYSDSLDHYDEDTLGMVVNPRAIVQTKA